MKKISFRRVVVVLVITVLVTTFFSYIAFSPNVSFTTTIEEGSMVTEASYVIFVDGSTYYARNGLTGEIEYSGTNATAVIQNSLDSLPVVDAYNAGGGGTIFFQPGLYDIDVPIQITYDKHKNGRFTLTSAFPVGVTIRGQGDHSLLQISAHNSTTTEIVEGVRISNIFWEGNQFSSRQAGAHIIDVDNCGWLIIEHNYFMHAPDDAIHIHNPRGFITINNNMFWSSYGNAIDLYGENHCEQGWIANNELVNNGLSNSSGNSEGIRLVSTILYDVENNYIKNSTHQGIYSYGSTQMTFNDNKLIGNGYDGMLHVSLTNSTIIGNVAKDNGLRGVDFHDGIVIGDSVGNVIVGNRAYDVVDDGGGNYEQTYGIHEEGTSNWNLIVGNNCVGNNDATWDIVYVGTNSTVADNIGRYTPQGND